MRQIQDPRHSSRKYALSALFCWIFSDPQTEECVLLANDVLQSAAPINDPLEEPDRQLMIEIIEGVQKNVDALDLAIEKAAPEWPIDKIAKIDLVILRIALYEILYGEKTPVKVAIDEAVELAKEFGNDTSSKFVNGVLGTVVENSVKTGV